MWAESPGLHAQAVRAASPSVPRESLESGDLLRGGLTPPLLESVDLSDFSLLAASPQGCAHEISETQGNREDVRARHFQMVFQAVLLPSLDRSRTVVTHLDQL